MLGVGCARPQCQSATMAGGGRGVGREKCDAPPQFVILTQPLASGWGRISSAKGGGRYLGV